jgi:hypothetical protein
MMMFQKRVLAVIVGGLFGFGSTAAVADAGSAFPKDNSRDYAAPVVVIADAGSSFPKDNSRDYVAPVVVIADAGSPFPKDNSRDYVAPVVVVADAGSPFPKDNSRDYATPIDGMYLAKPEAQGAFPKDDGIDRAIV